VTAVAEQAKSVWRHPVAGPLIKIVLAFVFVFEGLIEFVFGRIPILDVGLKALPIPQGIFVLGLVIGTLYGLVAMGLILVYRANRIINFAQAELGAVPAVAGLLLMVRHQISYFIVLPLVIVAAALLGAGTEFVVMRRFNKSPRLITTVATIGVAQLLAFCEFYLPKWLTGKSIPPQNLPTPFNWHFQVGIVRLRGDHIVAIVVVIAIMVGLGIFFRLTDIGIAVRASAENGERASLLGIPVKRVSTIVWALAAVLSAIGLFLRAPIVGLPIGGQIGPSVLLFSLAAAVMARMESLPTALIAGISIGMIDQATTFSTHRPSIAEAIMLFVILGALLVQRGALSRAYDAAAGTWQLVREFRPVPSELVNTSYVRGARTIGMALIAAFALGAPFVFGQNFALRLGLIAIYAMVGVSLVILTGWAGQISLGQFAFTGVGAAVAGGLAANHHTDFFVTLLLAGLAGAVAAVLIGLPAVRVQGLFLAVTTLAFAFAVKDVLLDVRYVPWLLPKDFKFAERPNLYGRFSVASDTRFYFVCLFFLCLTLLAAHSLRKHRTGRILIGVRDNHRTMQAYGVSPARSRLAAFAISGFIAALAGALFVYQVGSVNPDAFPPGQSLTIFALVVIGGLTSLSGAVLGALYVVGLPLLLGGSIQHIDVLTTGVGLLFLLLFLPGGLSEGTFRMRDWGLRWVAARLNIHVPSLVADSLVLDTEEADQVLLEAERHVESVSFIETGETITCPACGEDVVLAMAREHEHFAGVSADAEGDLITTGATSSNGNGHRASPGTATRRTRGSSRRRSRQGGEGE
jgi:branched-chain amino acid transport system permease protein